MKDHFTARHPGPWRVMQVDSEVAGIFVAVGFLAMGLVSIPIARWFVLGCFALGIVVALILRFTSKRFVGVALGTLIALVALPLWRAGGPLQRPHNVSYNALHVRPNNNDVTSATRVTAWIVGSIKMKRLIVADSRTRKEPGFSKMCLCHV